LVVEREEKLWLRRVVMSHNKVFKEEEICGEDLFSFEKPEETVDHAVFVGGKLYLKCEKQIVVANEGVVAVAQRPHFQNQPRLALSDRRVEVPGRAGGSHARGRHLQQKSHS